jgi:hypothetical protein
MAPSRPLMYPEQFGLVVFTLAALVVGLAALVWFLVR